MLKSYKTELDPTDEQKIQINKNIGVCRYVYNLYLSHNKEVYEKENRFEGSVDFSKWLNSAYISENPDKAWIREVSSKAVKQSIRDAETAFRRFFKGLSKFPKHKKKGRNDPKMYFVKTDRKAIIRCERHRIRIPTLGWVRLKEKGYLPTDSDRHVIKSGRVSRQAGRYYVSITVETKEMPDRPMLREEGLGIDLGLKSFAVTSDEKVYKNISKSKRIRKLEKRLKREQRALSRKHEAKKRNKEKGGGCKNIDRQRLKVQRIYQRLTHIRTDYINKCVNETVKAKPSYITIEDLNVKGMMRNRHLSKAVASQRFYEFRSRLASKCGENGIELRIVGRWYPSSKLCHSCGEIKRDLKLSDRVYRCKACGEVMDRDLNAALNLRDAKVYAKAI